MTTEYQILTSFLNISDITYRLMKETFHLNKQEVLSILVKLVKEKLPESREVKRIITLDLEYNSIKIRTFTLQETPMGEDHISIVETT